MAERVTRDELAEALRELVYSLMPADWEPTEEVEDGWPAGANAKRLVARLDSERREQQTTFANIEEGCKEKMQVVENMECIHRRRLISGLGGCLCRADNCYKMNQSRLDAENGVQTREQKAVELCRRLTHVHDGCLPGECNYSIKDIITEADALFDAEQGQEQHCELFTTKRGEMQDCMSDGHYECRACSRLDPDSDIARLDAEREQEGAAVNEVWHHTERIRCPECGQEQDATVQHTRPFPTYIHDCEKCGYTIMESEWEVVE